MLPLHKVLREGLVTCLHTAFDMLDASGENRYGLVLLHLSLIDQNQMLQEVFFPEWQLLCLCAFYFFPQII